MYEENLFLTDYLAGTAQTWVEDFRKKFWLDETVLPNDISESDWKILKALDQVAAQMVKASKTLEFSHSLHSVIGLLKNNSNFNFEQNPFFNQLIESHFVGEIEDDLANMRHRSFRLLQYLVEVDSERVRSYLVRVASCFLRGFKAETIVMSGAVLDAALQEALNDGDIRSSEVRCGRYVSLGNRIEFLRLRGDWDEDTVQMAYKLANGRNNVIHTSLESLISVEEALTVLVSLLKKIDVIISTR